MFLGVIDIDDSVGASTTQDTSLELVTASCASSSSTEKIIWAV
jgi:hypothetical protein